MQYEVFTVPVLESAAAIEQLNRFLRGHKVVQVEKQLLQLADTAYWSFCVHYIDGAPAMPPAAERGKTDYRAVLSDEHFKVFSQLRTVRKKIADEDAVPAFAVFTDAELASMAQLENLTAAAIAKIDGIANKRMEKYGLLLLQRWQQSQQEPPSEAGQPAAQLTIDEKGVAF